MMRLATEAGASLAMFWPGLASISERLCSASSAASWNRSCLLSTVLRRSKERRICRGQGQPRRCIPDRLVRLFGYQASLFGLVVRYPGGLASAGEGFE